MFLWMVCTIYVLTSMLHGALQHSYAKKHHKQKRQQENEINRTKAQHVVSVILPTFNELPNNLRETLQSLENQTYPANLIRVYVVDDCSTLYRNELDTIFQEFSIRHPNWTFIRLAENKGKRGAQNPAFKLVRDESEFTLFGDCDSPFNVEAIAELVKQMANPRTGGVCGRVDVANANTNRLTRLLAVRYWMMFELERAALSVFGAVWLASGPIAFYRTKLLVPIWESYQNQTYKDVPCVTADDVCLTNLVLQEGYEVIYTSEAVAKTHVPDTREEYLKQQLRWNRDKFRDQAIILRSARMRGWYPLFDAVIRTYIPFALLIPLFTALVHLFTGQTVWTDVLILALMLCVRALITYLSVIPSKLGNSLRFTLFYGLIHALFLIPIRIRAYATRKSSSWVTR